MPVNIIPMNRQDEAGDRPFLSDRQLAAREALAKRLAASKSSPNAHYLHHAAAAVDKFAAMRKRQQIEQERIKRQNASQKTFGGLLSGLFKGGDKGVDVASADPVVTPPPAIEPQKIMSPPPQIESGKIPDIGSEVGKQEIAPANNYDPSNIQIDMVKPKRDIAPVSPGQEQMPLPPKQDTFQEQLPSHLMTGDMAKQQMAQNLMKQYGGQLTQPPVQQVQQHAYQPERAQNSSVTQLNTKPLKELDPQAQLRSDASQNSDLYDIDGALERIKAGSTIQGTDENGFNDLSDPRFGSKEIELARPEIKTASLGRGNYFENLSRRESGGRDNAKAPSSSATGRYQFIDQTWLGMMKDHGAEAGYPEFASAIKKTKSGKYIAHPKVKKQILDLRTNGQVSDFMAAKFTDRNADYLKRRGLPDTQRNLYMVHHFGGRGANLAKGNDKAHVGKYLSRSQLKANPYLRNMTVGQLKRNIDKSFPEGAGSKGVQVAQNSPFTQEQLMEMYKNPETRAMAQQLVMDQYKRRMKAQEPVDPKLQAEIRIKEAEAGMKELEFERLLNGGGLDPEKELKLEKLKAETELAKMKLEGKTPNTIAEEGKVNERTTNIRGGLENLANIPKWAETNKLDFEGAIGPFDNSWLGRSMGHFSGNNTEHEVQRKIAGDTEALAAAIKPLIRKPGEGAWTDADQERLVSVVGDLLDAKNLGDYNRSLAGVRDRINSNFGLNIGQLSFENKTLTLDDLKGKVDPNILSQAQDAIKRGADPAKVRARILGGQ